jgi:hypothetical protein
MTLYERFQECIEQDWRGSEGGVRFKVIRTGNLACVFFQYTYTATQVLTDIDFLPKLYKNEPEPWRVHGGFGKAFKSFIDANKQLFDGLTDIECIGYSYGGAIATLFHEWVWFQDNLGPIIRTFTFGAPDVCWMPSKSVKARFDNLYNINVRGDIVPELLPHAFPGFQHVGHSILIGDRPAFPSWERHGAYAEELKRID